MTADFVIAILAFCVGACLGSFVNVCIYRMPLNRSILYPRSHCAACGAPIPWKYNIPIFSWFWLRGRAACCGTRMDAQYVIVEGLVALGVMGIWLMYPLALALIYTLFFCGLVTASFVDMDHFIIPDEISLGGCLAGLALSLAAPELHGVAKRWDAVWNSFLGIMFGGGLLLVIAILGALLLRKEAMGMGDIKLMAMMGAFLGWQAPIFIVIVSSVMGAACGIFILMRKQKMFGVRMPYGPYLALAGILWVFGGREWWMRYIEIFNRT
ncbi:MAG: prepilin peptidase [Verrucomicrobiota bacterium]